MTLFSTKQLSKESKTGPYPTSNGVLVSQLKLRREWGMPSADTFDVIPIHNFVKKYLHESRVSIDPFARNKRWATYTNDLNPQTAAEYHMEAAEFLMEMQRRGVRADLAIFDPPYSPRQVQECYQSVGKVMGATGAHNSAAWSDCRDILANMMTDDATVLSFGWNSTGMGKKHGFHIIECLLVNHGACHNDTICVAEKRAQGKLFEGRDPINSISRDEL